MAQFVVLEPLGTQRSENTVFLRDGFHLLALVLPVVWLLLQRLWFEAFAVFGIMILLGIAGSALGFSDAVPLIVLLVSVFVALEGINWKIAKLKSQGFTETAVIDAPDLAEAEIRYFQALENEESPVTTPERAPLSKAETGWAQAPRPTYSSFDQTIGFVGHRGEN